MMSSSRQAGGDGQTDQCGSAPGIRRTGLVPSRASSSDSFASCFSTRQPGAGLIAASFARPCSSANSVFISPMAFRLVAPPVVLQ